MTRNDSPPDAARSTDNRTPAEAAVAGQDALEARFKPGLAQAPYYSVGRNWDDYAPAYRFGRDSRLRHEGRGFDEIATQLEQEWAGARDQSRLGWIEARGAIEDAWALPPDEEAPVRAGPVGLPARDVD